MKSFIIDYGYNNIDHVQANDLDHVKEIAAENCSMDQEALIIKDTKGNELARSQWFGVIPTEEDIEIAVAYWANRGFYAAWWDL